MFKLAYLSLVVALGASLFLLALEVRSLWAQARPKKRLLFAAIVFAVFAGAVFLTGHTALRAGFGNYHDFEYLSAMPLDAGLNAKEISPIVLFSVADILSRFSLDGILVLQKALWLGSGLLLFGALRAAGLGYGVSALSAGLFFLNFLSILCTYSFSTTNANIFYVMAAVYGLAAFRFSDRAPLRHLALYLAAAFLVFSGRLEFFPPILLGLAVALLSGGWKKIVRLWNHNEDDRIVLCAVSGLFAWACFLWSRDLAAMNSGIPRDMPFWRAAPNFLSHLNSQLGAENLTRTLGIPPAWCWPVVALSFLSLGYFAYTRPKTKQFFLFWASWLGAWILYFSVIFMPCSIYPLQQIRHHIYFFIPAIFLFGIALSGALSGLKYRLTPAARAAAVIAALGAYLFLNLRHVNANQAELRTNDLEWQFLYSAQDGWDKSCKVIYPWHDALSHRNVLRKYFPYADSGDIGGSGCVLLYSSPIDQVFSGATERWDAAFIGFERDVLATGFSEPYRTVSITHRFSTDWWGGWQGGSQVLESTEPVKIEMGFYRLPERLREKMRARSVPAKQENIGSAPGETPGVSKFVSGDRKLANTPGKNVPGHPPALQAAHPTALPAGYEPGRDSAADIRAALALARAGHKRVLVIVGGDWCNWCPIMGRFFAANPDVEAAKEAGFVTLKVFYNPAHPPVPAGIAKYPEIPGYPHIYVLAEDGTLLASQDTTRLESGSTYDRAKFLAFLETWSTK